MPRAAQIIRLLKSHIDGDNEQFYTTSMQVAADEARKGHDKLAVEIKNIIDEAKKNKTKIASVISFQNNQDLSSLLTISEPSINFSSLTYSQSQQQTFRRILHEIRQQSRLREYGLEPRRKLLCYGKPGTGKTISASALAAELSIPLFTVRLDGLITKFMGETANKLRQIFDATKVNRGVYFFDEFDAIGNDRLSPNDVGEIRRVLNSFLQFLEQNNSDSLIIAATNHEQLLDEALFRRFDDVIYYGLPEAGQIKEIIENRLCRFKLKGINWNKVSESAKKLSHAEIVKACDDAAKAKILNNKNSLSMATLIDMLKARQKTPRKI